MNAASDRIPADADLVRMALAAADMDEENIDCDCPDHTATRAKLRAIISALHASREADVCARKHQHSGGSDEAWRHAQQRAETWRMRILDLMESRGTITQEDACDAFGKAGNELSGRFRELENDGLIERLPEKRPNRNGIRVTVYMRREARHAEPTATVTGQYEFWSSK